MASLRDILLEQGSERVGTILQACPRKTREELFRRLGIKGKGRRTGFKLKSTSDERSEKFFEALSETERVQDEVLQELVRSYLYTRRPLLADALDFLEVPHKEGLTDDDIDFITELPEDRARALQQRLTAQHGEEDTKLYLRFMNVPHV